MRKDPEETYSLKEKLAVAAVLLLPVALAVVAMIGEKRRLREVEAMKNRPVRYYEYAIRPVDTVLNHPVGLRGRSLFDGGGRGDGCAEFRWKEHRNRPFLGGDSGAAQP